MSTPRPSPADDPPPLPEGERKLLRALAALSLLAALGAGGLFYWTSVAIEAAREAPPAATASP